MKKIFMLMTFVIGMILTTTASADSWIGFHEDSLSQYFIDTNSVAIHKNEDGVKIFSATFKIVFTDKGRKATSRENYKETIAVYAFAKEKSEKFYSVRSRKFYALNGSLINSVDKAEKWQPVKSDDKITNAMFNIAELYLVNVYK